MSSGDRQPSDDEPGGEDSMADEYTAESMGDDDTAERDDESVGSPPISTDNGASSDPWWKQLWTANDGPLLFVRELLLSLAIVSVIGLTLFAISGVWPPMVAVESDSMEPNINQYDLVVVSEAGRYAAPEANEQGLVMAANGGDHESFNRPGSVIVYDHPGRVGSPIIHRTHFTVDEGENWYDRADPDAITAENCVELNGCPAPHAGYITKGDNNARYDQASGIAPVVRPRWVDGVAQVRIPYLGRLRLVLLGTATTGSSEIVSSTTTTASVSPVAPATTTTVSGGTAA
ncbi:S26 family signal peptidase [Halonotius terrestris]|uniref:S26 family signal peptidase n=1 Tax=Halonotius terrestris TaxID=2487750 RepID=A0A8J8PBR8_9EURY|nr:S26 family signal peptidase [Halonotius terrestris]TQQ83797.1 S26 family signal peptidase [Halonotius terrestris]